MKSSILARPSPRQILRPVRDGKSVICKKEHNCKKAPFTHQQKMARKPLVWQTFHLCPGSEQDKSWVASPTQSHHRGQRSAEDRQWYPADEAGVYICFWCSTLAEVRWVGTFSMKKPCKVTSWVVLWGSAMGTMLASLWVSWMTASVKGRLFLSSTWTWRDPITLLSSSWTWSSRGK